MLLTTILLLIFLVHLVAFAVLGIRRRQLYYAALVVTFALLSGAMTARLVVPGIVVMGGVELAESLRYGAWAAAAVSISWTVARLRMRRLRRRALADP